MVILGLFVVICLVIVIYVFFNFWGLLGVVLGVLILDLLLVFYVLFVSSKLLG